MRMNYPGRLARDLHYDSIAKFLADVDRNPMHSRENSTKFASATYDEARAMADTGWEITPNIDEIISSALQKVEGNLATVTEATWGVAGSTVDIGRYLAGDPESMVSWSPIQVSRAGRVVRLVYSVTLSASISAQNVLKRGAAIYGLAVALEECQHSTEIWLDRTVVSVSDSKWHRTRVLIKSAQDSLDTSRLAFWLAHPAVLRQLCFRVDPSGNPQDPIEDMEPGTIYLPTVNSRLDIPDPEHFITDKLTELGLIKGEQHD